LGFANAWCIACTTPTRWLICRRDNPTRRSLIADIDTVLHLEGVEVSETWENVISGVCAVLCLFCFLAAIASIGQCDARQSKSRDTKMMECVRQQCNWIDENCLCALEKK
jgi:hypothetical protein